ncbi:MAG TPA: hypothetical protein VGH83_05580 [Candidatus Acidoferrum sp.]|jgi:hypothetical protein
MANFWVNGIVAQRNGLPYIQLSNDKGMIGQLSMNEARQIAQDILIMAARCEADAMILKFFKNSKFPEGAAAALLVDFRDFRAELDQEEIEHTMDRTQFNCIHCGQAPREHSPDGRCTPDGATSYQEPPPPPPI